MKYSPFTLIAFAIMFAYACGVWYVLLKKPDLITIDAPMQFQVPVGVSAIGQPGAFTGPLIVGG